MKSIFYLTGLFFLLCGCTSTSTTIRSKSPDFVIKDTYLKLPDIKSAYFESEIFNVRNIKNCLCYRYTNSSNYYNSSKENVFMIDFDQKSKSKTLKYFKKVEESKFQKNVLHADSSYWIGNKHYFNFETDSAKMFYFTQYNVKDGIGEIDYDSSFIAYKNGKSSFSSAKYNYKKNEVTHNENGKILIQKYFFVKNQISEINFLAQNSRVYKKIHFKYDDNKNLTDLIIENNYKSRSMSNIKKFNYSENGLLLSIVNYKISKSMLYSYLEENDSSCLISVPHKNEFFEYSFL